MGNSNSIACSFPGQSEEEACMLFLTADAFQRLDSGEVDTEWLGTLPDEAWNRARKTRQAARQYSPHDYWLALVSRRCKQCGKPPFLNRLTGY